MFHCAVRLDESIPTRLRQLAPPRGIRTKADAYCWLLSLIFALFYFFVFFPPLCLFLLYNRNFEKKRKKVIKEKIIKHIMLMLCREGF